MSSRTFTRLAGASLIVTTSMVGCSGAQMEHRPALASNNAEAIATGIEKALASRDFATALLDAERLVAAQPREAASRTLLGRAYLANGRYASARTALEDALTLGANDPRTLISLSLVRTAMGNPDSARALLSAHIGDLPASDYGLAMAMAGDVQEGSRALMEAVHAPEADAQTRQNLAYVLALGGQWGQARLVAGQDLSGAQLQQRLAQWAQTAQAEAYPQRVAAFLGVQQRADDSGMPERLALSSSEPTSLAEARPLRPTDMAAEASGPSSDEQALAAAQPEPVPPAPPEGTEKTVMASLSADAAFAAQPSEAAPTPLIRASTDPMREAVMKRLAEPAPAPKSSTAQAFASPRNLVTLPRSSASTGAVHGGSDWVVQIGAYSDDKTATAAWARARGQSLEQRGYRKIMGQVTLNGRTYHRLAMSGFSNRTTADQLCANLRSSGQTCFVRHDAGVANDIRMAWAGKPAKTAQAANPGSKTMAKVTITAVPAKSATPTSPVKIATAASKPARIASVPAKPAKVAAAAKPATIATPSIKAVAIASR
ncbi:MAG TPA: SPOR domain-containing protein [Sphingobium sp.]